MSDVGRLILHRFNGDEIYRIADARITARRDEDGNVVINFEIETSRPPIQSLPDTEPLSAEPNAAVTVILAEAAPLALVERTFHVATAWDEAYGDHVSRIYYVEHEGLDNNEVRILGRQGSAFHVKWIATTTDVSFYDGSKPNTRVEIEAVFAFPDAPKWVAATS